jgi:anti-sigma regulatory factor (Ser/Thr protein kinase)
MEVTSSVVTITDRSAVGEVRRGALALAHAAGFDEDASGRVAIVATELAGNIAKHGERGHCFLSLIEEAAEVLVQIVAIDSGPGIAEPSRALQDGYSTVGTSGTGLGAVQRMSRDFDLFSHTGGTVVVARVAADRTLRAADPRARAPVEVGVVAAPLLGEPVSGDTWMLERYGATTTLLLADGLGHGPFAAQASGAAAAAFRQLAGQPPAQRAERIHEALRSTRGAAIAVAEIDPVARSVRYAGIGNIAAQVVAGEQVRSLVSMSGTAGHQARTIREFSYDFPPGALLVVHSDGVSTRWALDRYPGITLRDPAVIAALLHRDHSRGRDDATVVVARHSAEPAGAGPAS